MSTESHDIPGGSVDGVEILRLADASGGIFEKAMGCHLGPPNPPGPCIGFVLAVPYAPSLRMPILAGLVDPDACGCDEDLLAPLEVVMKHGCANEEDELDELVNEMRAALWGNE